jgi:hypothetical protein
VINPGMFESNHAFMTRFWDFFGVIIRFIVTLW